MCNLKSQKKLIKETDWQNLIILDACRYDYFKEYYKEYLDGDLKLAISPGTNTLEWLKSTFKEYYNNILYISGNPFINSEGSYRGKFKAKKHFQKVVDVWKYGWSKKLGGVPPKKVTKKAVKKERKEKNQRKIIHYLQPHYPYLDKEISRGRDLKTKRKNNKKKKKLEILLKLNIERLIGTENLWKLAELFGFNLKRGKGTSSVWARYGRKGIIEGYIFNLKEVLKNVSFLTKKLSGKTIVTADHGELLGEYSFYGHRQDDIFSGFLRKVPWLEIEE